MNYKIELNEKELENVTGGSTPVTSEDIFYNSRNGDFEFDKNGIYIIGPNKKASNEKPGSSLDRKEIPV